MVNEQKFNSSSICSCCQVCELGQQLEEEKSCSEDEVRRDRQEVSQYFEALEVTLARKKRAFLDAVDKSAADVLQAFEPLIERVKELQVCVCKSEVTLYDPRVFAICGERSTKIFWSFNTTNGKCSGVLAAEFNCLKSVSGVRSNPPNGSRER